MHVPPDVESSHAYLSPQGLDFVRTALRDPEYLRATNFASIHGRGFLNEYLFKSWPVLVDAARMRAMALVAERLDRVYTSLPERLFELDAARVGAFYGLRPDLAAAAVARPTGAARSLLRSDFMLGVNGLQLLEVNGGFLGGWHFSRVTPLFEQHPLLRRYFESRGLTPVHVDTVDTVLRHLASQALDAGLAEGDDELNVAFTLSPSDPQSEYGRIVGPRLGTQLLGKFTPREEYVERYLRELRRLGGPGRGDVFHLSFAELELRERGLYYHGRRVHAIYEYVGERTPAVMEAVRSGRVHLYPGAVGLLLGDKRTVAALSESIDSDLFDDEERRLVQAHVPWMRVLRDSEATYEGTRVALPDFVRRERERFVLKQGLAFGGAAVHVGRAVSQDEWEAVVARGLAQGSWVVQQYVAGRPQMSHLGDGEAGVHDVVWGLFTFGGRYSGSFVRLQPQGSAAVINMARGASAALVFEV